MKQKLLKKIKNIPNLHTILSVVYVIGRDFVTGHLPLRATSLVYTTILSFVPLLALSFSVLKSFGVHNQLKPFLEQTLEPLGAKGMELTQTIVGFVDNIQVGVLGAIGLAFLIFTVVSLIQKIEDAFNDIWHIHRNRNIMQRFTGYLSVVTIGPIIAFSLISLKTKFTSNPYVAEIVGVTASVSSYTTTAVDFISGIAAPVLIFTLMNKFIPNTKVKLLPAFMAGIITAILWKFAAHGFASFISGSVSYDAIYSSFAIILITFIWLYLNWLIVLIGGSFCFYIQNPQQAVLNIKSKIASYADMKYAALLVLKALSNQYTKGEKSLSLGALNKTLKCDVLIHDAVEKLVMADILSMTEKNHILLTRAPATIYLSDVLRALSGESILSATSKKDAEIKRILEELEAPYTKKNLAELFKLS